MSLITGWMAPLGWLWLILIIIFIITEIATLGLTTIWFAGGAAVGLILNAAGIDWPVQVLVFLVVSLVLLLLVRPVAKAHFNVSRTPTNVDSMIGQKGIVAEDIDNLKARGTVMINGMDWSARSADQGQTIPEDTQVEVVAIEGNKVIVKPYGSSKTEQEREKIQKQNG